MNFDAQLECERIYTQAVITSLLFADEVILLASLSEALSTESAAFIPAASISTSSSEAVGLSQKRVDCTLWVVNESVPQV